MPFEYSRLDLGLKPVHRRRPKWAESDEALMNYLLERSPLARQIKIARLYWRQNRTAREIAAGLYMSVNAVELVIKRLKRRS